MRIAMMFHCLIVVPWESERTECFDAVTFLWTGQFLHKIHAHVKFETVEEVRVAVKDMI